MDIAFLETSFSQVQILFPSVNWHMAVVCNHDVQVIHVGKGPSPQYWTILNCFGDLIANVCWFWQSWHMENCSHVLWHLYFACQMKQQCKTQNCSRPKKTLDLIELWGTEPLWESHFPTRLWRYLPHAALWISHSETWVSTFSPPAQELILD